MKNKEARNKRRRTGIKKSIIDFIESEEGGIDKDKVIKVGGITLVLFLGSVSGGEYGGGYAHNNYVVHTNFVEWEGFTE